MKKLLLLLLCFLVLQAMAVPFTGVTVSSLQVEGRTILLGLDLLQPRLSWKLQSSERGVMQTAYEILVASSPDKLAAGEGDVWNSGVVKSEASINVVYSGRPLQNFRYYWWKVRVHTTKGISPWSNPALWSMGILDPSAWKARWIGLDTFNRNDRPHDDYTRLAARYIRKNITTPKRVARATAFISGLGLYELYINGRKVGDAVLAPTVKEYNKVVPYNTLDVTGYLKKGPNAIGVILGNGRFFSMRDYRGEKKWRTGIPPVTGYGYPKLLLQVRVEYSDGTTAMITTDDSWKVSDNGPILANSEFDGEEYDANKEWKDWAQPWFNDRQWRNAELVAAPASRVESQLNENIKVKEVLKPVS
ncbi:MAG TPA: alpha-L-rhamnosidase N-terminal domain-containing protein, partial [Flavisolibacter sp.]|nr:alpha-L-rhamnosidase N-terminal domain-containing protein [Flavisolibacter sp.]